MLIISKRLHYAKGIEVKLNYKNGMILSSLDHEY